MKHASSKQLSIAIQYDISAVSEIIQTILTSRKTKSNTVFGPRRMNAGVQPLKRNLGPSSRKDWPRTLMNVVSAD